MIAVADVDDPVFVLCPDDFDIIVPDDGIMEPVNCTVPIVTDNSGVPPTLTTIPADFKVPYTFTQVKPCCFSSNCDLDCSPSKTFVR